MRLRRKVGTRRFFRRLPSPAGAPAVPPPPPVREARPLPLRMRCMCGILVEVGPEDHGKRETCETCQRRFDIRITNDGPGGQRAVSLHYRTSGETSSIGSATTVVPLSGPLASNGSSPLQEPEPPAEPLVKCRRGALLAVFRKQYEEGGRWPAW